ncbi:MAG: glucose-1-phosphate cytidylyltransferase [Actinomycetota bacterium]|nr:glucose-1-phosphate cytidylyltransferase [Actinomycetota bacterium]
MKAVILAGGFGTRISEESAVRPKPMVEIGGKPIIWHIMKLYSAHGIEDFVICAGYKAYLLKQYFANYFLQAADIVVDLKENRVETLASTAEPWRVTIVDTGESTMTGGRIRRAREVIGEDTFCLTYGDCVTDLDIGREIEFHRTSGADVTVAAIQPPGRFGMLTLEAGTDSVTGFREKPTGDGGWVNGGFFVVEPRVLDYIDGDQTMWEHEPLERIAGKGGLRAFKHDGFWHPMDTLHDKMVLEEYWASGSAPWKVW